MVYTGTTNKLKRRIIPSFDLRESYEDGRQFFMSLYTRKDIHINDWVEFTIDNEVVKRVEELEKFRNNPPLTNIQCLSGQQEYPFWTTLQGMKTKDMMKKTPNTIL